MIILCEVNTAYALTLAIFWPYSSSTLLMTASLGAGEDCSVVDRVLERRTSRWRGRVQRYASREWIGWVLAKLGHGRGGRGGGSDSSRQF